jgi:hypothetical protein
MPLPDRSGSVIEKSGHGSCSLDFMGQPPWGCERFPNPYRGMEKIFRKGVDNPPGVDNLFEPSDERKFLFAADCSDFKTLVHSIDIERAATGLARLTSR